MFGNVRGGGMLRLFNVGHARIIRFAVLTITLGALISADAFVLQWLIDAVQRQDWRRFGWNAALTVGVIVVQALVYWRRQTHTERLAYLMLGRLRERLFAATASMPIPRLARSDSDRLFSQLTTQLDQVKANLIDVLLYGAALVAQTLFAVVGILVINPVLGTCALVLCTPMALVPVLSKRHIETARGRLIDAQNDLNGELGDLLRGAVDWRLMHREPQVRARFAATGRSWFTQARGDADMQMRVDAVTNMLSHALIVGIWLIGGLLIMRGGMTVAQVVALYAMIGNISVPLFQMSGLVAQYHAGRETLRQLVDDIEGGAGDGSGTADVRVANAGERHADGDAVIGARSVAADAAPLIRYHGVRLHHVGDAFDHTFDMRRRYLLTGPSGSGKSSILRVLYGLDDDYDGSITVDGVDVRSTPSTAGRRRIGYLSQHSHLFADTVRENVRLFDTTISDDIVLDALRRAQLGAWTTEHGLDYRVDDSLNRLSGGERQRLLLARLLAQGYEYCLLDEFDTGLDAATAQAIGRVIDDTFAGFIVITHHPEQLFTDGDVTVVHVAHNTIESVGTTTDA